MPPRLVNAHAMLWMKAAATAVALLALAVTSSTARGAIRSSVDRDFLRAHFEAHLLHRDWLLLPRFLATIRRGGGAAPCCQRRRRG